MIFAFDHEHKQGDVCSITTCEYARRKPALCGDAEFNDVPMLIVRIASVDEYLKQPIPDGWVLPALEYGCNNFYEIHAD